MIGSNNCILLRDSRDFNLKISEKERCVGDTKQLAVVRLSSGYLWDGFCTKQRESRTRVVAQVRDSKFTFFQCALKDYRC